MSEIKLISPLLDDFIIGDVFSDHNGVRCVPAMKNNSDTRYIVKVISVPASQVQVQAFLLTGVYHTEEAAKEYFAELAANVEKEMSILSTLSAMEGFVNYEGYQVVEKEGEIGYDIYLLAPYRRSLERHYRKYPMTHLGAVNLGLDMCAALSVARQAGYLVVDLKPGNIFIGEDNEYRIGDIGFLPMNSLRFATLHDRYRSPYTAPEVQDPFAPIGEKLDIYAAGLVLYQAYNGGALPFVGDAPNEVLQPPLYADYEMSEIILKACAPDPADRWDDPIKMGQAIVSYMQRNGANDTPIAPPIIQDIPETPAQPAPIDPETAEIMNLIGDEPIEGIDPDQISTDELLGMEGGDALFAAPAEETPATEAVTEEIMEAVAETTETEDVPQQETLFEESAEPAAEEEFDLDAILAEVPVEEPAVEETQDPAPAAEVTEEDPGSLRFMDEMVSDETAPDEETAEAVAYSELSDDANDILAQVDDLIAHEAPAPLVVDEMESEEAAAIVEEVLAEVEASGEVPATDELSQTVAAISLVVEAADDPIETQIESGIELPLEEPIEEEIPIEEEVIEEEYPEEPYEEKPKRNIGSKLLIAFLITVIIGCIVAGGYLFYRNFYMKTVDKLYIKGEGNNLTVSVLTDADTELLSVICTDTYGNKQTAPLLGGTAVFTDLAPDSLYRISIDISGFHGLTGETKGTYTTAPQTEIMSFSSITGPEIGTVILNFTVKGFDAESWVITYSAPGEQEQTHTFSGHSATISGLTENATYTFVLDSEENAYVFGQNKLEYTAAALIYPEDLKVTEFTEESLTVEWKTPEGTSVSQWTVMCYNDSGYSQNVTTAENKAVFTDVDRAASYTIEVTAAGMSVGEYFYISKNAVIADNFNALLNGKYLDVSWGFTGNMPAGNWILTYLFEDSETEVAVTTDGTTARIENVVPKGNYTIKLRLDDGTTVLNDVHTVTVAEAAKFEGYGLKAENIYFSMCMPPDNDNWIWWGAKTHKTEFAIGEKAGFVIRVNNGNLWVADPMTVMCVVRDKDGKLLSTSLVDETWSKMWTEMHGEIDLPNIPTEAGEYTVEVYFNSTFVHEQSFTVIE